ncbi:TRAP dicarboxylate transporter, DctM subunit [Desulfofundulus kuznetsovii DSM 6115]|uniref:TRAP dicarboxylate transporter, DctM subunit n=1 Tax=Desulfofundulus kuznetsovii (strain DSM 6115 / VKM B-1805 / 17) TaxID=760568 RepID=A0AAU8PKN6_DESK7|nr:TRAP dicarboxylate transporter, DctM subunit [Desulfofundulus kuznetsovii DSM 6115]
MSIALLLVPFAIALLIGVPISFSLGIGVLFYLLFAQALPLDVMTLQMYSSAANFPLMAIPFFVLAGDLMNRTGITERLIEFCKIIFGRIKGGLSQVMVATSTVFAGLTGSATADTAAMIKILGPAMEKEGYGKDFTASLAAAAGVLGPIIPPSTIMIVYGATVNTSVGAMFLGGILPGILIAVLLMVTAYIIGLRRNFPKSEEPFTIKRLFIGIKDAALALVMPIIIMVGIRGGVFTPTEGGAVAAAYSIIIGAFVYRTLKLRDFFESALTSGITASIIMLVVAASNPFGWILSVNRVPQDFAEFLLALTTNKYIVLLLINAILLLAGMFLEGAAIVLLLAPILAPVAAKVGVDPVHFAIIMTVNICIGMATPPVGVNLFVAAPVAGTTMSRITRAVLPFVLAELVALAIITFVPPLTLFIPNLIK